MVFRLTGDDTQIYLTKDMGDGTLPYRKPTPRCALIDPQGLLRLVGGPA